MAEDRRPLSTLDVSGPAHVVAIRWQKWKRSFQFYTEGQQITDSARRRALLLHYAGRTVQDIYETLEEDETENDVYQRCVDALSEPFQTEPNILFERYTFRQMAQKGLKQSTCLPLACVNRLNSVVFWTRMIRFGTKSSRSCLTLSFDESCWKSATLDCKICCRQPEHGKLLSNRLKEWPVQLFQTQSTQLLGQRKLTKILRAVKEPSSSRSPSLILP